MSDAATTRQIALRKRPDLEIHPHHYAHERCWVVKDPVTLNYYHLRDEEHAILQMLDGRTSLDEIKKRFEETFAPLQLSFDQLHVFLGGLYRNGLVLADVPGQAEQLLSRREQRGRRKWLQAATSLLAIQFPGVDPEPFLQRLYPKARWLFSWWFFCCCFMLVLGAALLAAVQHEELLLRLPDFHAFFNTRNVLLLAVALALIKVLHELGHALTCKHYGGECHEIGVLLLVFTPCLYCVVSDSWMLSSKWKRIAISAAGVWVEIVLAALCTFLWWFTEPGLLNTLCLNVMFVCSVSTLLFNGNPLLRYDGYYVLADFMEVPNLSQQSRAVIAHYAGKWFLGMPPLNDRALPESRRWAVALYGVAAMVYRVFIVLLILWFCYHVLKPYGLAVLAEGLAVIVAAGLLLAPIVGLVKLAGDPRWRGRFKMKRVVISCCVLTVIVAIVFLVPLPHRIVVPVVIGPQDARRVYVSMPGSVVEAVAAGERVEAGQLVGRLANPELELLVEQLKGQYDQQKLKLEHLERRSNIDPNVLNEIPTAREIRDDLEKRLADRKQDVKRLELLTTGAGTVFPPPARERPYYEESRLLTWSGSPLDASNRGCFMETGTLFCIVGNPARMEGRAVVSQADFRDVCRGQRVRLRLDQLPGKVIAGRIVALSQKPLEVAPPELDGTGRLAVLVDQNGVSRPADQSYEVRVELDGEKLDVLIGTSGHAKIYAAPQTLGSRLLRMIKRTFHFDL